VSSTPAFSHFFINRRNGSSSMRSANSALTTRATDCRRKYPQTTHPHNYPEQVTIIRPAHPFEGKTLNLLGATHRKNRLLLLLILPDGSKSLVPADWTNLNSTSESTNNKETATLGSLSELLHMRTVVDAPLRRNASAEAINKEESNGVKAAQLSGPAPPGDLHLGTA
jgi:hypothetical protein